VRVTRSRIANLNLRCPATTGSSCRGILQVSRGHGPIRLDHGRMLSRRSFSSRADVFAPVRMRLSVDGYRRLVRNRKMDVTVMVLTRAADGQLRRATRRIQLYAPRR